MTDISEQVIRAYQAGERWALQDIYDQTSTYVYSIALRMIGDPMEAQDVVHDIFIKLMDVRGSFNHQVKFTTWLYRVVTNHILNQFSRKKRFLKKMKEVFFWQGQHASLSDEEQLTVDDNAVMVHELLQQLKPDYRMCVVLRYVDDLSYADIAEQLGIEVGTVKSRLNRAKDQLRALVNKEVGGHDR